MTYYVVNLDRSVNGQVSFQLRDGQGNLVNFSGATTGGAMQRFSVDNPAGALLNANGSLTLPKAHGLATGDKVVVNLGAQGVLTGLTDNHVYVVEVIDSNTLRFKQVDGSAVTLASWAMCPNSTPPRDATSTTWPMPRATSCSTARASPAPSIRMHDRHHAGQARPADLAVHHHDQARRHPADRHQPGPGPR